VKNKISYFFTGWFLVLWLSFYPVLDIFGKQSKSPRLLIIGDSISIGYSGPTRELLKDKVEVFHNKGNAGHTGMGLENIKEWLGDTQWDIIHFNWGLWDLCYRNPDAKTQGNRDKINGKLSHTLSQYEKNLLKLVQILKETGAQLVWATTTPVPENEIGRFKGDEIKYNAVAKKIMKENGIMINDLYSYALQRITEIQIPGGDVHFIKEGYEYLAKKVAKVVMELCEGAESKEH